MTPGAGPPIAREPVGAYRLLASALALRARRLGSRDPESAMQEALRRSLENPKSQPAIEYYLGEDSPDGAPAPEWRLDQLLAWLHGVLLFVVREEQGRAPFRREVSVVRVSEHADSSPGTLDLLIQEEVLDIVSACFKDIDREYRQVLELRRDGWKYGDIARRLGLNVNTVATLVSRGVRQLGCQVRRRMGVKA
jgi:DNA-directed RNA polymerase specialized sigma24 family protein